MANEQQALSLSAGPVTHSSTISVGVERQRKRGGGGKVNSAEKEGVLTRHGVDGHSLASWQHYQTKPNSPLFYFVPRKKQGVDVRNAVLNQAQCFHHNVKRIGHIRGGGSVETSLVCEA
jgi:hypothetical protein